MCGDKGAGDSPRPDRPGSPPRMRGKDEPPRHPPEMKRITPAYAGKRNGNDLPGILIRDHPRVCGEKSSPFSLFITLWGSPPRMRGKE